jgi:hypothetical protein
MNYARGHVKIDTEDGMTIEFDAVLTINREEERWRRREYPQMSNSERGRLAHIEHPKYTFSGSTVDGTMYMRQA